MQKKLNFHHSDYKSGLSRFTEDQTWSHALMLAFPSDDDQTIAHSSSCHPVVSSAAIQLWGLKLPCQVTWSFLSVLILTLCQWHILCLIKVRCNCFHPISWIISCDSLLGVESLLVPIFHSWQFLFHRRWPSVASSDTSPHSPTVGWALEITRHWSYQVRIVFSQISWLT